VTALASRNSEARRATPRQMRRTATRREGGTSATREAGAFAWRHVYALGDLGPPEYRWSKVPHPTAPLESSTTWERAGSAIAQTEATAGLTPPGVYAATRRRCRPGTTRSP
jgi:hypothetical protein